MSPIYPSTLSFLLFHREAQICYFVIKINQMRKKKSPTNAAGGGKTRFFDGSFRRFSHSLTLASRVLLPCLMEICIHNICADPALGACLYGCTTLGQIKKQDDRYYAVCTTVCVHMDHADMNSVDREYTASQRFVLSGLSSSVVHSDGVACTHEEILKTV